MSRLFFLSVLVLLFIVVNSEVIVSDNFGDIVSFPQTGGNATGGYTVAQSNVRTSPYLLSVFITDPVQPGQGTTTVETFFMANGFGAATLVSQSFTAYVGPNNPTLTGSPIFGNFLGNATNPNTRPGVYLFNFSIPVTLMLTANITFTSTVPQLIDTIFISITNPNVSIIVGDPQFVGLRGQSYQVHGVDGAVYNIISEKETQVNSRFVFLSEGKCPIFNGVPDTNCWSHPGSYLGELSFQQIVDGKNHAALVTAGSAKDGFSGIQVDGKALKIGDKVTFGTFVVDYTSSHKVSITTAHFRFSLSNSDRFINQGLFCTLPLSRLQSHGLLGQTHSTTVYAKSANRYIEGTVDDYVIGDDNIFGTDFIYNQFQQ